jgi:hypothetical protein
VLTERGAAAALLTCVLLLAGCGGGEADGEQLPPPPTPGTSPEEAPDASGDDATADEAGADSTEEGSLAAEVERAVRDYYDAINAAQYEGKIDELEAKATPDCNCQRLVETVRGFRQEGEVVGAKWRLQRITVQNAEADAASVIAVADVADGQVLDQQGDVKVNINNEGRIRTLHAMVRLDGRWLVAQSTSTE